MCVFLAFLPAILWYCRVLSLFSVRFFGYRYLGDSGTDRREIFHDATLCVPDVFFHLGEVPQGISKTEIYPPPYGGYCILLTHLCSVFYS